MRLHPIHAWFISFRLQAVKEKGAPAEKAIRWLESENTTVGG
jgi:hypothetical protein